MKKGILCILLATVLLCSAAASAAPGMSDNPAIFKSYLDETLRFKSELTVDKLISAYSAQSKAMFDALSAGGDSTPSATDALTRTVLSRIILHAPSSVPLSVKAGTALSLNFGATVHMLSGSAEGLGLTDLTEGRDIGGALTANHRYLSNTDGASVKAVTDTTILLSGSYRILLPYVPLYKDLCDALMTLGLIDTYELSRSGIRVEMFAVFTRVLGVRQEAETYTGKHPFTDVPLWADKQVAYLYNNGFVNGTGGNKYSPDENGSVQQMCFILLKALGYIDGIDISYNTAVADAVRLGLFTKRETEVLQTDEFTRDVMMYMTYYSLFASCKDSSERLIDRLVAKGQVSRESLSKVLDTVTRKRF